MRKLFNFTLLLILIPVLVFSGCGSSSDTAYEDVSNESMAQEDMSVPMAEENGMENAAAQEPSTNISENDLSNRKLIRNVNITMETKDFDSVKTQLHEALEKYNGYAESSSLETPQYDDAMRHYSLTLRIPSENLDAFLAETGTLGTVTYKNETVEDVTLDYVDLEAYKSSLETEYQRVTELLQAASDLDQILALESKLSDLRYQLDSLESQLRTYDNLVEYSTVYLEIHEVDFEQPMEDSIGTRISNTFHSSLDDVIVFFQDFFVDVIGNIPKLIVLAVVITVLILIFRPLLRKKKKKTKKEEPKPDDTLPKNDK